MSNLHGARYVFLRGFVPSCEAIFLAQRHEDTKSLEGRFAASLVSLSAGIVA